MTVHKGGIVKYLDPALRLIEKYKLDVYYSDRLKLVKDEINSIFPEEDTAEKSSQKQISLTDFMRAPRHTS